jgi:hypothetical protein|tara:strand:+ start:3266 stop:3478 length:213 start_codon:yes stop_codon:yes gene_type:complete
MKYNLMKTGKHVPLLEEVESGSLIYYNDVACIVLSDYGVANLITGEIYEFMDSDIPVIVVTVVRPMELTY